MRIARPLHRYTSTAACAIRTSRSCRVALPFCHLRLSATRPRRKGYPEAPQGLGEHLRKRRMDLGLRQADVARTLRVKTGTLRGWEVGWAMPDVRGMGRVVAFLGYDPTLPAEGLPARLAAARRRLGLTQRELARLVRVNNATISNWETGETTPLASYWPTIIRALGGDPRSDPTTRRPTILV
jgi:DNA-binding transcriptional regulator YiaG